MGQQINVIVDGDIHDIWTGVKRKQEENAEARGHALVVNCDLNGPTESFKIDGSLFITKCRWDAERDIIDNGF